MSKAELTLRNSIYLAIELEHFKSSLLSKVALVTSSRRSTKREIAFILANSSAMVIISGRTKGKVK
jgi:hypothetical protein